ncbi:glycoside hydrolase family protein [Candidatus Tisiphia endosymbiont of Hybos culiciformis]|uniref:glycoside hydrolase family protein n=1 Tax=Candidatus Tisiphia endosymbiont of Hybos culiciformis TaxID=3139331 RepID=UPI003CCB6481
MQLSANYVYQVESETLKRYKQRQEDLVLMLSNEKKRLHHSIDGIENLLQASFNAGDPRLLQFRTQEALYKQAFVISEQIKHLLFNRVNNKGEFNVPMGTYKNPAIVDETNIIACSKLLQNIDSNDKAEYIIKSFEGLRLQPYYCPAGLKTIGWGHAIKEYEQQQMSDGISREHADYSETY